MPGPKDTKTGAKKPAGSGKPVKKGKPASRLYDVSGHNFKRKNKSCPKCGNGTYMAAHKDRATCGKCGYTERK